MPGRSDESESEEEGQVCKKFSSQKFECLLLLLMCPPLFHSLSWIFFPYKVIKS
jgi:hypothetical protein